MRTMSVRPESPRSGRARKPEPGQARPGSLPPEVWRDLNIIYAKTANAIDQLHGEIATHSALLQRALADHDRIATRLESQLLSALLNQLTTCLAILPDPLRVLMTEGVAADRLVAERLLEHLQGDAGRPRVAAPSGSPRPPTQDRSS